MEGSTNPGVYKFSLDAVINANCTVRFEVARRSGGADTVLLSFEDSYVPLGPGEGARAQLFEYDSLPDTPSFDFASGDLFVFRYSAAADCPIPDSYIPNGDGMLTGGDIPHITFP